MFLIAVSPSVPGHLDIEDHHIDGRVVRQNLHGGLGVVRLPNRELPQGQSPGKGLYKARLVIDEEHVDRHRSSSNLERGAAPLERCTPLPVGSRPRFDRRASPRCRATPPSPSPVPVPFLLGGEERLEDPLEMFVRDSGAVVDSRRPVTQPSSPPTTISTRPSRSIACTALVTRLSSTWRNWYGSEVTGDLGRRGSR